MKSARWAIIGMGVFVTTGIFAITQFGGAENADGERVATDQSVGSEGQSAENYSWTGRLSSGESVEVKGINGDISVTRASGSEIEIVAEDK